MKSRKALQTRLEDDLYQNEILQRVSRTFALTIPELPEPLYQVVANAYLLCRIADTIEDDKAMPAKTKREYAERFIKVVRGVEDPQTFSVSLFALLSPAATEAEYDLIANTEAVIRVTHSFSERQRGAIERCIAIMADGMAYYQDIKHPDGITDLNDMGRYCYYVAGVVGEMLTELFCDYSPEIDRHRDELMKLSVCFGQGLQMTNILKDIWEDHTRGACWLPRDVFKKHGFDTRRKQAGRNEAGFNAALLELLGVAHAHLHSALRYTLIIPAREKGLRRFCLWALGMAVLTLDKVYKHPSFTEGHQVKISRRSVKITRFLTGLFVGHDRILTYLFRFSGRHLPTATIHEILR